MLPSIADAITAETNADLKEAIESAVHRCEYALRPSRDKLQELQEEESDIFDANKNVLDYFHALAERHQKIYGEREKLSKRLPSNQLVNVIHNALLEEHDKESIFIDESYTAVKLAIAELREHRARRSKQAQETHEREAAVLEIQIAHLRNIAEIAGVPLDCPVFTAQYDFFMGKARVPFRLPPPASQTRSSFRPAKPRETINPLDNNEVNIKHGISNGISSRQKPNKGTGSAGEETLKRCDECNVALDSVHGDAQAVGAFMKASLHISTSY